jgi:hypothetical protein
VARIAFTALGPNTIVSPKANVCARLRLFGPKVLRIASRLPVRSSVAGRCSM